MFFFYFFLSVIEFGVGPEFLPGYQFISNWDVDNSDTILGRCYCYFRNSWPNFPTREDCTEFYINDGVFFFVVEKLNETQKHHKSNFSHIMIIS